MDEKTIDRVVAEEMAKAHERIAQRLRASAESTENLENCTQSQADFDGEEKEIKKIRRPIKMNGVEHWISADSEQEYAEKIMALVSGSAEEPAAPQKQGHPFGLFLDTWMDAFKFHHDHVKHSSDGTSERNARLHIKPYLGHLCVEERTTADVQQMLNHLDGTVESNRKVLSLVRHALDYAVEQHLININPAASSSLNVKGKKSVKTEPYTVEQMQYLVAHIRDLEKPQDRAWLAIMCYGCVRPEETLGLRWGDVDLKQRQFNILRAVTHPDRNAPVCKEVKTETSIRHFTLPPEVFSLLVPGKADEWIVGGSKMMSYTAVSKMCQRIKRQTGADFPIVPSRFRTTVATDIYEQTKDLVLLQNAGGWASAAVPLKYYAKGRSSTSVATQAIHGLYHPNAGQA